LCEKHLSVLRTDDKALGRRIGFFVHRTFASHFRRIVVRIDEKKSIIMAMRGNMTGPLKERVGWICKGFDPHKEILLPMLRTSLEKKEAEYDPLCGVSLDVENQDNGTDDDFAFWYGFKTFFQMPEPVDHLCCMFEMSAEKYLFNLGPDAGNSPFWKGLLGNKIVFVPHTISISRAELLENARKVSFLQLLFKD
jgi:hypothetical protein